MVQNYTSAEFATKQPSTVAINKILTTIFAVISVTFAVYTAYESRPVPATSTVQSSSQQEPPPAINDVPPRNLRTDSVATVVAKALYFESLLTSSQLATLQQTYTTSLARKWSNLPCGSGCRNGIQLGTLSATQLAAALDVIKAAAGTTANEGYDEFYQIRLADKYLNLSGGGNGYDSTMYFLSFLNAPTITGQWMIQFGGHHYAQNIAYNAGKVVGTTPSHQGVEPRAFTINSVTYSPLKQEHDSMTMMLAGLTSAQLTSAKLSSTFSDCVMLPGETNGGPTAFPAKAGLKAVNFTTAQKNLVITAIRNYTKDADDSAGAVLQAIYASEIDSTYIGWTGSGTSGDTSTFLNANTNYVRIDGPSVWIEFICQNGVVFQNQIHYHSVYRDHSRDYGNDLTRTTLPLDLLSFEASIQGKSRILTWKTTSEKNVDRFEIERSSNPSTGFINIGSVNTNTTNNYTFYDNEGFNNDTYYYRLKIVDVNGSARYSNIAVVRFINNQISIAIYPNPAKDLLTISLPQTTTNATIKVISENGKILIFSTNRSGRNLNIDISSLARGSYFVQLQIAGVVSNLKFMK